MIYEWHPCANIYVHAAIILYSSKHITQGSAQEAVEVIRAQEGAYTSLHFRDILER